MGAMKKVSETRNTSKSRKTAKPLSRPKFQENYPELLDFLEIPRRSERGFTTGCMTIFFEDLRFKICLNDRPNKRSVFLSSQELSKCFQLAEAGLMSNSLNWRQKGYEEQPAQKTLKIRG